MVGVPPDASPDASRDTNFDADHPGIGGSPDGEGYELDADYLLPYPQESTEAAIYTAGPHEVYWFDSPTFPVGLNRYTMWFKGEVTGTNGNTVTAKWKISATAASPEPTLQADISWGF